ncbi:MAG: hypothetical protein ABEL04_14255 [Salinibacter sp.]|uniref:hypothetical protein n=1 Tax=Salinibacter sp. TaxID=2065818 RepID=UPI0035D47A86
MVGLSAPFYLHVALWAAGLHGVWEYGQVIPFYRCWGRWTTWQRIWILPAATLGDAVASIAFAAGTAALLGPSAVRPLSLPGASMLLGLGLGGGVLFETVALNLDFWRYKEAMPTLRIAGHDLGLAPVLQMTVLPVLSIWIAG